MKRNQSKSFHKEYQNGKYRLYFEEAQHLNHSKNDLPFERFNFEKILKQLFQGLMKLFVVLKYFFHTFIQKPTKQYELPWYKIGFLSLAAVFVLKSDFNFNFNVPNPALTVAYDEEEPPVSKDEAWFSALSIPSRGDAKFISIEETEKRKKKVEANPFAPVDSDDLSTLETKAYIRRFAKIAVTEMNKYGVPASIKMAQGIIESRNGGSRLAKSNNNHFGIKCFSKRCAKGHCANFNDDHHKDFFRKYESAWEGWRAHSKLLSSGRYKKLQKYGIDYVQWSEGLKQLGYATDKNYDRKLIKTIEKYKLHVLDEL